jgi:hypothetical protein
MSRTAKERVGQRWAAIVATLVLVNCILITSGSAQKPAPSKSGQEDGQWHRFSEARQAGTEVRVNSIPGCPEQRGVYYKGPHGCVPVHEVGSVGMRTKGWGAAILTSGIAPVKHVEVFLGRNAELQVEDPRPTFYFVDMLRTPPRDIAIVKLAVLKDHREVQVGSSGAFKEELQYRISDLHPVSVNQVSDDVIAASSAESLPPGEYLIVRTGMPSQNGFDFGITGTLIAPAAPKK